MRPSSDRELNSQLSTLVTPLLYLHIPFCASRCIYCDFYAMVDHSRIDRYLDALVTEASLRAHELPGNQPYKTLYMGGGTPSILSIDQHTRLATALRRILPLDALEEWTVEVNPDDVTPALMQALADLGVNRISMGIQSFVDSELQFMRRRHDAQQAIRAVDTIRQAGIHNISIDLIYGVPGQTLATLDHSLDCALSLDVQHISVYGLSFEVGTRLWVMRQQGQVTEVDDDTQVAMNDRIMQRLRDAGFEHYEISNYARPGFHSRHNSAYWDGTPYLGLGTAAHSFDGNVRRSNPRNLKHYLAALEAGRTCYDEERLLWWEQYDELVMLAMRTAAGLDTRVIQQRFGQRARDHFVAQARPHLTAHHLTRTGSIYRITPTALILADSIIRDLMWDN